MVRRDRGGVYTVLNTLIRILVVDEALPRTCAQPPRRMNTRAIVTRVPRHSRLMTTDPPPNGAAYADEGDANLLLSFHVCLTRKHAMPQVHSRFRDMPAKHRDGRDKRPRHEVSACPSCHACIYHLYTLQAFFHYASAWLLSPDQGLGSVTSDEPVPTSPPDAIPLFHVSICNTWLCVAQELVYGRSMAIVSSPRAALEDPKDPSRGHEDGRAATCDGASGRPCCASRCQVPLRWLPLRHGPLEPFTEACTRYIKMLHLIYRRYILSIYRRYIYRRYIVDISAIFHRSGGRRYPS